MAHEIYRETVRRQSDDRSLGELFSDLARDASTLVNQEIAIAKTELSQKAAEVGKDAGFLAAGGLVAYTGILALVAALIIGLGQAGLPWWLSAFIVGVVIAGIGAFLIWKGLNNLKRERLVPEQTVQSLKEDAAWAKAQTH